VSLNRVLTGNRKISWSKSGCVACISPDNYSVNLRVFSRDAETGKWDIGKDVPLELPQGREVFQLTHLSWSHLGNDLAVIDEAGHVMIFSCLMALDRMHFERIEIAHPESEMDAVVGMHWLAILPYGQKVRSCPALKKDRLTSSDSDCLVGRTKWGQVELEHSTPRIQGRAPPS
jgi:hypothetical protein